MRKVRVECDNCHFIVIREFDKELMPIATKYIKTTTYPECTGILDLSIPYKERYYDKNWEQL